jgi:hypothetical protein
MANVDLTELATREQADAPKYFDASAQDVLRAWKHFKEATGDASPGCVALLVVAWAILLAALRIRT